MNAAPLAAALEREGWAVSKDVLDAGECEALRNALADLMLEPRSGGHRNLLARPEVAALCRHPHLAALVRIVLGASAFACKATLFNKTPLANWKVAWHQDLAVALRGEARPAEWRSWSLKAGVLHAQPPPAMLENMLALRLHLDDCNADNGALRLIPGSHRQGRLDEAAAEAWKTRGAELRCDVQAGGVLMMRPLLLHASSVGTAPGQRRVLHLEFAAQELPAGLDWAERVAIAPG
jgi:ectoine hydroxylase-related dioxygenase (phytanoyl-CoA dioxygenase family)